MIPHLRFHSEYSFTHGLIRLRGDKEIGRLAKERGIAAVAITDTNNISGAVAHYRSCLRHGVKPILGCHALFRRDDHEFSATLLCERSKGFKNLSALLSEAQQKGDGRIDARRLEPAAVEGITMLTGYEGDVCDAILKDKMRLALDLAAGWRELFTAGRLACELTFGGREGESTLSMLLASLAMEAGIPGVATHPALFADREDYEAHEVRACIANSWKLDDQKRPHPYSREQHLPGASEMRDLFAQWPQALDNAAAIARRCNYNFGLSGQPQFPRVPGVERAEVDDKLRQEGQAGLDAILQSAGTRNEQAYKERLENELVVITSKGFADYFLIVAELVGFARDNGIPVGPGRGSGAGSLVAYSLGITNVDPIEHGLLFERFLNPERTALPDFDIDFCKDRRDEVINHARDLYGQECVSQVITFGTLKAKAVVRDVCRVLGFPYTTGDTISRLIPVQINIKLSEARSEVGELEEMLAGSDDLERMWNFSLALEGLPRQGSTHAAAILITPSPLVGYCPLIKVGDRGKRHAVSQYDMDAVEAIGLIKFDILGLKNLTMLDMAEKMIKGTEPGFSLDAIDLLDDKMFEIYRRGNTIGIFQCESQGMVNLIKKIAPKSIEDIAVSISLYRPGALNTKMDEKYLDNRNDPGRISYPHPSVREILEPTYGAMIYQEQPMKISQVLAGFSLAKADLMRAAIGKKDATSMAALGEDFIAGSSKAIGKNPATALFEEIKEFAGYGFNKSHAISYALISLQTAFLKAHHKTVFYASSLSTWCDDPKTQVQLLRDAEASAVKMLPPDINRSGFQFTAESGTTIRFGIGSVRGVGNACAETIVADRERNGLFKDIDDLCIRTPALSRKGLENLVSAGAFDSACEGGGDIHDARASLHADVSGAIESAAHANRNTNQEALFGDATPARTHATAARWTRRQILIGELTALGTTISGKFSDSLRRIPGINANFWKLGELQHGDMGIWAGQVSKVITNQRMRRRGYEAFVLVEDGQEIEVQASSKNLEKVSLGEPGLVLVVSGKADINPDFPKPRILADKVIDFEQWLAGRLRKVSINVSDHDKADLEWLLGVLEGRQKGKAGLVINLISPGGCVPIDTGMMLSLDSEVLETVQERLGAKSLGLRFA